MKAKLVELQGSITSEKYPAIEITPDHGEDARGPIYLKVPAFNMGHMGDEGRDQFLKMELLLAEVVRKINA
jgi:hypothetical protein